MSKYEKYKPSGIEWIGDVPEKWSIHKLYTDYIINHSPQNFQELTQDNIQGFKNLSAYKMLREILGTAA